MKSAARPVTRSSSSRRDFFKSAALAAAGATVWQTWQRGAQAALVSDKFLTVEKVELTAVEVPFREIPARAMVKEVPHWKYTEVCQVHLKSGKTGFGESLLFYTWGATKEEDVKRVVGRNAAELMWDDSLGAGLQIALFDAVGRTLEVPVHALLGHQVHQRTPLSWWNIDTSPEDMASECKLAYDLGYMAYKTKGRPWFDLWKQMELSTKVVPGDFKIDMDFNDTLLDADRAIPILQQFEELPQVDIWETPIPQSDLAGNRRIAEAMRAKVAMHYGSPAPADVFRENACDGFVVGGGASRLIKTNAVCEMADKPFWLQLVGTGITAAFSLHCGGALSYAQWPAVNCHQLYTHPLLTRPIELQKGTAAVPDAPGLGYDLDLDSVMKFKIQRPEKRPEPERLLEVTWASGKKLFIANNGSVNYLLTYANTGAMPYFEKGVTTQVVPNDGSAHWRDVYSRAAKEPFYQ